MRWAITKRDRTGPTILRLRLRRPVRQVWTPVSFAGSIILISVRVYLCLLRCWELGSAWPELWRSRRARSRPGRAEFWWVPRNSFPWSWCVLECASWLVRSARSTPRIFFAVPICKTSRRPVPWSSWNRQNIAALNWGCRRSWPKW